MSTPKSLDSKTVKNLWDQNQNKSLDKTSQSHKKKGTENIVQVIADGIQDIIISDESRSFALPQSISKETGLQLPEISRKTLCRKTQKAIKIYKLFEKIGIDKIKYLKAYGANSISELTNDQNPKDISEYNEKSHEWNSTTARRQKSYNRNCNTYQKLRTPTPPPKITTNVVFDAEIEHNILTAGGLNVLFGGLTGSTTHSAARHYLHRME
ncbi:6828_t:CDS:2 [Paraglomus occultum]|uniref:6828_t:CDS:1 n=1 Tax=Paraglomus occultum TaxID=144539 RepID=A0A9N8WCR9_9GLOM|nr:6828_t:CDS:2 [Paraglomus occultum]